jgi:hypothetical protein
VSGEDAALSAMLPIAVAVKISFNKSLSKLVPFAAMHYLCFD